MIVTKIWNNIVQFIQQRISLIIRYRWKIWEIFFHENLSFFRIFFASSAPNFSIKMFWSRLSPFSISPPSYLLISRSYFLGFVSVSIDAKWKVWKDKFATTHAPRPCVQQKLINSFQLVSSFRSSFTHRKFRFFYRSRSINAAKPRRDIPFHSLRSSSVFFFRILYLTKLVIVDTSQVKQTTGQ